MERKHVSRIGIPFALCALFFGVQSLLIAKDKGQAAPIVIAADGDSKTPNLQIAQAASRSSISPQKTYYVAWKLIKDQFYNQEYNGQNWSRWEHHYDGKLKTTDDAHKGIETMLASLGDPYTRFLDKDAFSDEKDQIEARLYGVGMQLGMRSEDQKIVVIAPIEGTPAAQAGMTGGDEILEVDGKPVKGQSLDQVVKQIRGPIDTKVTIAFMRKSEKKKVTLQRAEIPVKAVSLAETLPGNIGYIRLDSFISKNGYDEMKKVLESKKDCDGIILDLRSNPGGLLTNAVEIAQLFIGKGIIVSTIDAEGYKQSQVAHGTPICTQPLVVLINGYSASASEILSGALRDNQRAKLVGQKSFGKGLVQAINRLDDGSGINITIAKYLTPNDTDINKTGIVPDYKVDLKDDDYKADKGPWWIDTKMKNFKKGPTDGKDIQLNKALEVIKEEI
ncbi:MAG: S41 family peptidase, partial [Cyanobacteria bacterium REEB67]|nr:S41 family peptidase [Cyanobacteria bacterium REEB67]